MIRPDQLIDRHVNVGVCLDARMVDAAIVLAASIKLHARPERPVRLFALTDFESVDLASLATAMNDSRFELVPITCTNVHGDFPVRDHITAGTYLRFLLPQLLPDVARLIYLDADIVVDRNLEDLFDTPLYGMALAAMPDWSMILGSRTWPRHFVPYEGQRLRFRSYVETVLGLDCEGAHDYFNCGVMVFDLDAWRKHDIAGRTLKYLTNHPSVYYMDQDALNVIIGGRYARLDARWNAFANCSFPAYVSLFVRATRAGRRWEATRAIWRNDPWIIHFAGANKPWAPDQPKTPRDGTWWRYVELSPAKNRIVATYRAKETPLQAQRTKIPQTLRDMVAQV